LFFSATSGISLRSHAVKALGFLALQNCPESSGLPGRFMARNLARIVLKSRISKDALSYWNFSYLWEICRHQEGLRRIAGGSPFFVGKEGGLNQCSPPI
jgi:hypothetical protein